MSLPSLAPSLPPSPSYEDVCAVIKEELGGTTEELWASFDPVPIASASLTQVGRRGGGREGGRVCIFLIDLGNGKL
jgi:hypothetical protein